MRDRMIEATRDAKTIYVSDEVVMEARVEAERIYRAGTMASYSGAVVQAARRVAARHKMMPGPILAVLSRRGEI